jgi:hypothetical protein
MSALFSGQIVLENARQVGDSPVVAFDGQMWHGTGRVMTGLFRYYNHANLSFDDVGQYFAWIHVRRVYQHFSFVFFTLIRWRNTSVQPIRFRPATLAIPQATPRKQQQRILKKTIV